MKISKNRNEKEQTGFKGWIENFLFGPYRFLSIAGLLLITLAAGFLYAWKFHPRTPEVTIAVTTETPTPLPPMPVDTIQEEIAPLPVLSLSFTGELEENTLSARLLVNNDRSQIITVVNNQHNGQTGSGWQLVLSEENPDLLLEGKVFQLVRAATDTPVSVWLYGKQMREAGINVPDFIPVLVSIDDAPESVYFLIGQNPSTAGIPFHLPESFFTVKSYNFSDQQAILDEAVSSAQQLQNNLSEDELNDLVNYLSTLMKNPDEKINGFSVDLFSDYFANHDLWTASYEDLDSAPVFFYNSKIKIIEPAISDVNKIKLSGENGEIAFPFSSHPLYEFPEMKMGYVTSLSRQSTLERFESLQQEEYSRFHAYEKQIKESTGSEYSNIWTLLGFRYQMMHLQVNPPYPVRGFIYAEAAKDCIAISVLNLMVTPVDLESVTFLDVDIPLQQDWLLNPTGAAVLRASDEVLRLKPYQDPDIFMNFCIPSATFEKILVEQEVNKSMPEMALEENAWMINARISGLDNTYSVAAIPDIPPMTGNKRDMPPVQSIQQLTDTFPFLSSNEGESEITFLSGNWQVESDIVIPSGLKVSFEPGCQLYFGPDAVLLSFSALQASGTEEKPVLFSAIRETWPGMIVIDAEDDSLLDHVIVEKTGGIERGGWILTGGITFYRSPVTVSNTTLQDSVVEDAINVIRTTFTFDHLTIQRTPSDAFDSDFANGEIIDCHFENIGGDAIDISGAYVEVKNTTMIDVVDKGLSAGEDSHMTAENLSMVNMGIGCAAKDLSTLAISNSVIENAKVAGLAAYIKKSVFGPSSIEAENVTIQNTATETLVQTGSSILWNGKEQDTKDLNVKTLYELGILGN